MHDGHQVHTQQQFLVNIEAADVGNEVYQAKIFNKKLFNNDVVSIEDMLV